MNPSYSFVVCLSNAESGPSLLPHGGLKVLSNCSAKTLRTAFLLAHFDHILGNAGIVNRFFAESISACSIGLLLLNRIGFQGLEEMIGALFIDYDTESVFEVEEVAQYRHCQAR
jgi:hypothetical protein